MIEGDFVMSEEERMDRQSPGIEPTADDIRKITGAATPHFSQQIRARIIDMIDGLPENHPARVEGEREAARLEKLAKESDGRPRVDG